MRKNILFIIESSETGGAESIFAELVQHINRELYIPHVALLYEGWLLNRLRCIGIHPHIISNKRGGFDFMMLKGISALIRKYEIDLIHSHLFTTNVYSNVCGTMFGVPVISTFHGTMDVDMKDSLKKIKWNIINMLSRKIIFVSAYLKNYFIAKNLARQSKSQIIYNGIDIDRFCHSPTKIAARHGLGISEKCFLIGCVGDLRPAKDYKTALVATSILAKEIPELRIVIAGSNGGMLRDLEECCASNGISDKVQFLGYRADIENVFPAFDVYLSTSISEGFSLSVVEAMAAGLPVVATRSGGPEEIIRHGETGLLVDVGATHDIAAALATFHQNPKAVEQFGKAAQIHAKTKFSIQQMVARYELLYSEYSSI